MASKVTVAGTVEQVSPTGFKLNGQWFNKANKADRYQAPEVGQTITFDAYGEKQNLVYAVKAAGGSSNGVRSASNTVDADRNSNGSGAVSSSNSSLGRRPSDLRAEALAAAAALLNGSEGTLEQLASNTIAVARMFDTYLKGGATAATAPDELYWITPTRSEWAGPMGRGS